MSPNSLFAGDVQVSLGHDCIQYASPCSAGAQQLTLSVHSSSAYSRPLSSSFLQICRGHTLHHGEACLQCSTLNCAAAVLLVSVHNCSCNKTLSSGFCNQSVLLLCDWFLTAIIAALCASQGCSLLHDLPWGALHGLSYIYHSESILIRI